MVQKTIAQRARATSARSLGSESKDTQGRFYAYRIHPPKETPFLQSDEAILTFVEAYPEVTYLKTERMPDRDILIVKVRPMCNMFRSHATKEERALRRIFLQDVADRAEAVRDIPALIVELCQAFMARKGFVSLEWHPGRDRRGRKGGTFTFFDPSGKSKAGSLVALTPDTEYLALIHACAPYPAFTLEAAPP